MDYEIVKKIIKERFSLGEDGYKEFEKNLESNGNMKEFSFLNEDGRKFYKIEKNLYPFIDDGYKILSSLSSFVSEYRISFEDYADNKVSIKGNKIKIFKLASDYYSKMMSSIFASLAIPDVEERIDMRFVERVASDTGSSYYELYSLLGRIYKSSEIKFFREEYHNSGEKTIEGITEFLLKKIFEKIGCYKINTEKDLYFVISRNFNDFFLCSNGEGWTSCLNPESSSGFWSSLPFLVSDPNRCLCIISDLSEKEYLGIKSIRMFKRGWGELDTNDKINTGIFYPAKEYLDSSFFGNIGIPFMKTISSSFVSKYPLNLFYNTYDTFDFLYQDDTRFYNSREEFLSEHRDESVSLKRGNKNHTILVNKRGARDYHMCSYKSGLKNLIEENKEIGDFPGLRFCSTCRNTLDEEGKIEYNLLNGNKVISCSKCLLKNVMNNLVDCPVCGKRISGSNFHLVRGQEGSKYLSVNCSECVSCDRCSKTISAKDAKKHKHHTLCRECFETVSTRDNRMMDDDEDVERKLPSDMILKMTLPTRKRNVEREPISVDAIIENADNEQSPIKKYFSFMKSSDILEDE